ncbi:MAG: diguanylate cyclase [Spirochaetia bacterium]|nr:diguanylate cyclase [Spirochaetia bacterium]
MITLFRIATFFTALISTILAVYVYTNRKDSMPLRFLSGLMFANTVYATSYLFEISATLRSEAIFFLNLEYVGITFIPVFWVLIACTYSSEYTEISHSSLQRLRLLYSFPVTAILFIWTNAWHHLMYRSIDIDVSLPITLLQVDRAAGFWIINGLMTLLFFVGFFKIMYNLLHTRKERRKEYFLLILSSIPPFVSHMLVLSQSVPYNLDLGPLAFTLSGLLIFWGILNLQLFNVVSIAENMVVDAMRDAMIIIDTQGCLLKCNKRAYCFFDQESAPPGGLPMAMLNPEIHAIFSNTHADADVQITLPMRQEKRFYAVRNSIIFDKRSRIKGYLLLFHDITQVRAYVEELEKLASCDGLTGLFNHRHFMNLAHEKAKNLINKGSGVFCLIMFDLDFFKDINDTYGHRAGDMVLVRTAEMMKELCGEKDVCARYGGEEFIMLLSDVQPKEACSKANRLCDAICNNVFFFEGQEFSVTASFGVSAFFPNKGVAWDIVLSKADTALYEAKRKGKNQVVCM